MQASPITQDLKPVNLLASSEPLLLRDWLDEARRELAEAGFEDIQNLQSDSGFDWSELLQESGMLSLFSTQKCRIVNLPGGKPGPDGSKAIQRLCESADDSSLYIFVVPALDRQARNSAWCKAVGAHGRIVELKPVAAGRLADWLVERARGKGIGIDLQSAQFLAERTEGNLLAADQELEKLAIRFAGETLEFAALEDSVAQSARYSHYLLVDACLAGNARRALRILRSLETEGQVSVPIRWALQHGLQQLDELKQAQRDGRLGEGDWRKMGIWREKQRLYQAALSRLDGARIERLLQSCATLDRLGKGQQDSEYPGQDWRELESLVAIFCSDE
jgi:DNA polymerase-3 subunit delta